MPETGPNHSSSVRSLVQEEGPSYLCREGESSEGTEVTRRVGVPKGGSVWLDSPETDKGENSHPRLPVRGSAVGSPTTFLVSKDFVSQVESTLSTPG